ncbi:unnamed protein product [Psylliodes chrysocephalus]|uniref:Uncharacterized protein n=1 Tax=Psylliodes chrysocephalus TaxID=3402493 RepID=A0A9P0CDZ3_9CUCU|nr:unnamed protein product [Psylliodes chrysocephala]
MDLKVLFVACLALVALSVVSGAPRAMKNEDDLKRSVVEFLSQDKEFLGALEHSGLIDNGLTALTRQKRQSEVTGMEIDDNVDEAPQPDGFFDRAAKFVVDLLQRFLKWINSSDN